MAQVTLVALLLAAASGLANLQAANGSPAVAHGGGEVAFAAPANNASAASATASCAEPCYVVQEPRYPFPTCQSECDPAVCTRGYGVYKSLDVCCSPGVAFPDGCSTRPKECWAVENYQLKTCVRDDRKCMQGYGVYATLDACCAPGAAFPDGCGNVTLAPQPCYVPDIYYPTRQCRASHTLCGNDTGVQSYPTQAACCSPGGAFGVQGCSTHAPAVPCWQVEYAGTDRLCTQSSDVALCYRGWGVFASEDVCCTPGAGFPEGCTNSTASAQPAAVPQSTVVPSSTALPNGSTPNATVVAPFQTASTSPIEPGVAGK